MNNRDIIERYYRAHRERLVAYADARIHRKDEAEDMVQEVFLRLLDEARPICKETLDSLAYTLCRHLIADRYRRRAVHAEAERQLAGASCSDASAESVLSVREITERLEQGLARLSDNSARVYRLHLYDGLQVSDICRLTGEKYKAVEYRLGLARKHVRHYLKDIS